MPSCLGRGRGLGEEREMWAGEVWDVMCGPESVGWEVWAQLETL